MPPELWIGLGVGLVALVAEFGYLGWGDGTWDTPDWFFVPLWSIVLPVVAIVIAVPLLAGSPPDSAARTLAMVALVVGIAVVATWGLWFLLALLLFTQFQPSPQPCNVTCQGSGDSTCCSGNDGCCSGDGGGGCCGGGGGGGGCCGSSGGSDSDGGCCGSSGGSGSDGGCCGGSGGGSDGGSGGGCCGDSSSSGGSGGSGGSDTDVGAPGAGAVLTGAGLGAAALARRRMGQFSWRDRFAHHPDTPAYRQDVFRVAGARLCVGCVTTFPLFAVLVPVLATVGLPVAWSIALPVGLGLACAQAVSALGWARSRWQKVAVKAALAVGLAIAVVAIREAPWDLPLRVLAMLALAGLAYASTIPRRRRMAKAAGQA